MAWLAQNWVWLVLLAVAILYMMRRHGHGHGLGYPMGHHGHHHSHRDDQQDGPPDQREGRDPVSGRPVPANGTPISAVFRGRAYYFENTENRAAFEADPQRYAAQGGRPVSGDEPEYHRHHRRRGC